MSKITLLDVSGMSCGSCVRHVSGALRALAGVRDVAVELSNGEVRIEHEPHVSAALLVDAVQDAGYEASAPPEPATTTDPARLSSRAR